MRCNKKWVVQDQQTGLWLSQSGAFVSDKVMAGRFTKTNAKRLAEAKFGADFENRVWILELTIEEFRLINLAIARAKVGRRKHEHLRYAAGKRHKPIATENLITLLDQIQSLTDHNQELFGLPAIATQVRRDYAASIKTWQAYYRRKLETLERVKTEDTNQT